MDLSTLMPEQRRTVTTLDRPLFVSAGAGSGKTFTLTKRILWALSPESGSFVRSLDEVLAITFTNKAAGELKERVRRALMEEGMPEHALAVDGAWISTIHGMCSRILKEHALELGLDPSFTVLGYAEELKEQALSRVLAGFSDARGAYPALRAAYRLTAGGEGFGGGGDIASMARKLLSAAVSCAEGFDAVEWVRAQADTADLADAYRMLLAAEGLPSAARGICEQGIAAIEAYEASDKGETDVLALMRGCGKPRSSKAIAELMPYFRAQRADTLLSAFFASADGCARELADLAARLFDAYEGLKREQGGLDNDDLLRLAHHALARCEEVREAYRGRFKLVMVDEFQDTSTQQVELIGLLCGAERRELCTVGDAQQSIYRFRGADVSVFQRQEEETHAGAGELVQLARNFRSHADILAYVRRVFGGEGGLMPGFLDLEPSDTRVDGFRAAGGRRRQAVLVAGGTAEERARAKAVAVARRFARLRDAGQPVEDMVLLLGSMSFAGVYAEAVRAEGMACVIAGGSVFAQAGEVRAIAALLRFLANPQDSREGLLPVLASPLFALGADELLALATRVGEDGSVSRANIDASVTGVQEPPAARALPLAERACTVLRQAAQQVGRRRTAELACEVVAVSGWLARLEQRGAEGLAVAANVLKALALAERLEEECPCAPRALSLLFEKHLELSKEPPGALTGSGEGAVRIMTVHASKGLEFPVVAVAECYTARAGRDKLVVQTRGRGVRACLAPATFDKELAGEVRKLRKDWKDALAAGADLGGSDSAWSVYDEMRGEELALDLAERARLLYVAMTRAKEALLLVVDAGTASGSSKRLKLDGEDDLTGAVLARILPEGSALDADRLAFEDSEPGDFELVALADVEHDGVLYERNAGDGLAGAGVTDEKGAGEKGVGARAAGERAAGASSAAGGEAASDPVPSAAEYGAAGAAGAGAAGAPVGAPAGASVAASAPDEPFLLVEPAPPAGRVRPATPEPRDAYSYSSLAREHGAAEDDRAPAPVADEGGVEAPDGERAPAVALGSAFHAAAQLMVETGSVPDADALDALCAFWGVSPEQRVRLDAALARWERSALRAEALSWAQVHAEVPFFAPGIEEYGAYAEGAIDLLATDPARPGEALVVDYKTGGSPDEAPCELERKHALQARVYADALHRAGYTWVRLVFARVEHEDPSRPGEPQTVEYEL